MKTKTVSSHVKINVDKKLFVFGGAYGNLQATQAMLETAKLKGFKANQIIFTGDSIAYCANPDETANLIAQSGIHAIKGNCEDAIINNSEDCGCGFEEGSQCDVLAVQWYSFCKNQISHKALDWMTNLPNEIEINFNGFRLLCTHATPSSMNRFIFKSNVQSLSSELTDRDYYDGYIVGHSGIPFISKLSDKVWVNSGASGMPANDGTDRVWYAIIESEPNELHAQTFPLAYDYGPTKDAMLNAGLINGYDKCLETGLWPSLDILPQPEKSLTGVKLKTQKEALMGNASLLT